VGLAWKDVDFTNKTLAVIQAFQRIDGVVQITELKTDRARRIIAMPDAVIDALRAQQEYQAQSRISAGTKWIETGLVFHNQIGAPLEPMTLNEISNAN
jgi:integrase